MAGKSFTRSRSRPTGKPPDFHLNQPRFIIVVALLLVLIMPMFPQGRWLKNDLKCRTPSLYVQFWNGKDDQANETISVLFLDLAPADFVFKKHGSFYVARYEIDISIVTPENELLKEKILLDSVRVKSYSRTGSYDWSRLYRIPLDLPEGKFYALISLTDLHTGREAVQQYPFENFGNSPLALEISDLLLARRNLTGPPGAEAQTAVLPYPAKIFGSDTPFLFCYFEIYLRHQLPEDSLHYRISYIDPRRNEVILKDRSLTLRGRRLPVMYGFDTENLPPGVYQLKVEVETPGGQYQLERLCRFMVYQNPTDLRFFDFLSLIDDLRFIASPEELEQLSRIEGPARQEALERFWKKRDPSPGTVRNELMTEFYRRINIARQVYSVVDQQGKRRYSDQGKVYVIFGKPDQVIRRDGKGMFGEVEIWHYDTKSVDVIFRDDYGVGDFRLVAPNELLTGL